MDRLDEIYHLKNKVIESIKSSAIDMPKSLTFERDRQSLEREMKGIEKSIATLRGYIAEEDSIKGKK